ncbi:hypothetical protein SDC9_78282 [bioreactor metagenome]|uniref:Uncharacterized protein n=1 Tax=bioreactor metagenome TaxID=1076179 RepID=A0A644YT24_9ZZZZ
MIGIRRKAKCIERGERRPGIGKLRLRSVPKEELLAAPAAVGMLGIKQMLKRLFQPRIIRKTEITKGPCCMYRLAGEYGVLWHKAEAPVLAPGAPEEFRGCCEGWVLGGEPQFGKKIGCLQRTERPALHERPFGRSPEARAVIRLVRKNQFNVVRPVFHTNFSSIFISICADRTKRPAGYSCFS